MFFDCGDFLALRDRIVERRVFLSSVKDSRDVRADRLLCVFCDIVIRG